MDKGSPRRQEAWTDDYEDKDLADTADTSDNLIHFPDDKINTGLDIQLRKDAKIARAMTLGHGDPETVKRIQDAKTPEKEDEVLAEFEKKRKTRDELGPEIYLG